MDTKLAILFQILYFIRPQDWIAGLAGARLAGLTLLGLIAATLTRPDGFRLKDLFRTPMDFAILIFFGWVLYAANDAAATFKSIRPYYLYYLLTSLALTTLPRVEQYLKWWLWCLLGLTGIAVLTAFGVDITGAADNIMGMDGRLCLGTYQHDNPNALGHTVIVAIPLIYFWFIWRRPAESRVLGSLLIIPVIWVVYKTESKGAYIAGFMTLVTALLFGRSKLFKIIGIGLAVSLGSTALSQLPRMQQLSRGEQGVQGRLMAWDMARMEMESNPKGAGWDNFTALIYWERLYTEKATHSSYVQIGAALGRGGLLCYMGMIWCMLRTVVFTKTRNDRELRLQGMLYSLLVPFCLSSWMIDRAYHVEFFTMMAAVSAFHRVVVLRTPSKATDPTQGPRKSFANMLGQISPVPVAATGPALDWTSPDYEPMGSSQKKWKFGTETEGQWKRGGPWQIPKGGGEAGGEGKLAAKPWIYIGAVDVVAAYLLYRAVVEAWVYIIKNF